MPFISSIRSAYGPISKFAGIISIKNNITGGIISNAGGYRIHTFNDVGTNYFDMSMLASAINVEYLIIAGGGGGSAQFSGGGGGGAGGYRTGTVSSNPANYPTVVGYGGYYYDANSGGWSNGGNSSFNGVVSTGGGTAGGSTQNQGSTTEILPQAGGSGGGSWWDGSIGKTAGSGTSGQGYAGGNISGALTYYGQFTYGTRGGGGGGGAGGVGGNGIIQPAGINAHGGLGGSGLSSSITGSSIVRASGGQGSGAWNYPFEQNGVLYEATPGGGGYGTNDSRYDMSPTSYNVNYPQGGMFRPATNGQPNTGGGGGGGDGGSTIYIAQDNSPTNITQFQPNSGTSGGSGVVILRYLYP